MEKYKDRAAVAAVIEDLGLFPAWEAGKLDPELMPDTMTGTLAMMLNVGFEAAFKFVPLFRTELGIHSEGDYIKNITGSDYDKDVN